MVNNPILTPTEPEEMVPLSPWQAWWDIMPWDTVSDFREHVFNGFGIVHKIQKRNHNKEALAKDRPSSPVPGAAMAAGGAGGATVDARLA